MGIYLLRLAPSFSHGNSFQHSSPPCKQAAATPHRHHPPRADKPLQRVLINRIASRLPSSNSTHHHQHHTLYNPQHVRLTTPTALGTSPGSRNRHRNRRRTSLTATSETAHGRHAGTSRGASGRTVRAVSAAHAGEAGMGECGGLLSDCGGAGGGGFEAGAGADG